MYVTEATDDDDYITIPWQPTTPTSHQLVETTPTQYLTQTPDVSSFDLADSDILGITTAGACPYYQHEEYALSHYECVFMRKRRYEEMSDFPMGEFKSLSLAFRH